MELVTLPLEIVQCLVGMNVVVVEYYNNRFMYEDNMLITLRGVQYLVCEKLDDAELM
jgi:hypothetical protein